MRFVSCLLVVFVGCSFLFLSVSNSFVRAESVEVILVPHTHLDPGWLNTFEGYYTSEVRGIIRSVLASLRRREDRTFTWAETSFFERFFEHDATSEERSQLRQLIQAGRWAFVGGGWVQHDEGVVDYSGVIDQMTVGHEYLRQRFGIDVRIGWQIDPFGHSPESASLHALAGMDALVVNRVHHRIKNAMKESKSLEFIWKPEGFASSSQILVHTFHTHYSSPQGFDFEETSPVDSSSVSRRAIEFVRVLKDRALRYRTGVVMVPMGDDFKFRNADVQYNSIDILIDFINKKSSEFGISISYGTPSSYFQKLASTNPKFPILVGGTFMPYADNEDSYWTGYFATHPLLKRLVRKAQWQLRNAETLGARLFLAPGLASDSNRLLRSTVFDALQQARRHLALVQHHDGITGTSKSFVMNDYFSMLDASLSNSKLVISAAISLPQSPAAFFPWLSASSSSEVQKSRSFLDTISKSIESSYVLSVDSNEVSHVVIYNSLSWDRSSPIWVSCDSRDSAASPVSTCAAMFVNQSNFWVPLPAQQIPTIAYISSSRSLFLSPAADSDRIPDIAAGSVIGASGGFRGRVLVGGISSQSGGETVPNPLVAPGLGWSSRLRVCSLPQKRSVSVQRRDASLRSSIPVDTDPCSTFADGLVSGEIFTSSKTTVFSSSDSPRSTDPLRGARIEEPIEFVSLHEKSAPIHIANDFFQVNFDPKKTQSRGSFVQSIRHLSSGQEFQFEMDFFSYQTMRSGAYLFRPEREATISYRSSDPIYLVRSTGVLVEEMRMLHHGLTCTLRLYKSKSGYDEEWTHSLHFHVDINPLPSDTELVLRVRNNIQDGESIRLLDGLAQRKRSRNDAPRSTHAAAYNPSTMGIRILRSGGTEATLIANRAVGVATCGVDCFEIMLHRRLSQDDGRGLGEGNNDQRPGSVSFLLGLFVPNSPATSSSADSKLRWPLEYRPAWWNLNYPVSLLSTRSSGCGMEGTPVKGISPECSKALLSALPPVPVLPVPRNFVVFSLFPRSMDFDIGIRVQNLAGESSLFPISAFLNKLGVLVSLQETHATLSPKGSLPGFSWLENSEIVRFDPNNEISQFLDSSRQNSEEEGVFISQASQRLNRRLFQVASDENLVSTLQAKIPSQVEIGANGLSTYLGTFFVELSSSPAVKTDVERRSSPDTEKPISPAEPPPSTSDSTSSPPLEDPAKHPPSSSIRRRRKRQSVANGSSQTVKRKRSDTLAELFPSDPKRLSKEKVRVEKPKSGSVLLEPSFRLSAGPFRSWFSVISLAGWIIVITFFVGSIFCGGWRVMLRCFSCGMLMPVAPVEVEMSSRLYGSSSYVHKDPTPTSSALLFGGNHGTTSVEVRKAASRLSVVGNTRDQNDSARLDGFPPVGGGDIESGMKGAKGE